MEHINRMELINLVIIPCSQTNVELSVPKPHILLCTQRKHGCITLHNMFCTNGLDTNINISPHTCHIHHPSILYFINFSSFNISQCTSAQLLYYSRYLHRLHVSTIYQSFSGLFLSFESQDAMHTSGSHRVYIRVIHKIKSFASKGVTCKLSLFTSEYIS